ncbi:MAG: hypothetical protein U0586_08065 [Candidatus Brocadiaceae bacterium]
MKGCGKGYGFDGISDIGLSLEQAAKEKNAEEIQKQAGKLSQYLKSIELVYD